jgi:hypothetical protein
MGGIERIGYLDSEVEHLLKAEWLLSYPVFECLPLEHLHGDEWRLFPIQPRHINFIIVQMFG